MTGMPESGAGPAWPVPTLETARLRLRPIRASDWEPVRDFLASERSVYMDGPFGVAEAWGMFCADHAQWGLFGCGGLMIERASDGLCLGEVGISSGPLFPEWELGWMLWPEHEGQGIALEAAARLRDWARGTRNLPTLVSYVDPGNVRSARLAERLGAVPDPKAVRPAPEDLVFRHFGQSFTVPRTGPA